MVGKEVLVVFPVISAVLAAVCAFIIGRDQLRRPRPDKLAWSFAFLLFAVAAGSDAVGRELGWSVPLARVYYSTGPALVVAFLAVGELYLLFPRRLGRFAPGAVILLAATWITLVLSAPIDHARLSSEGWEAIQRDGLLVTLAIVINVVGTSIIVGGLLWSVWRFRRTRTHRNRMVGCLLIVAGTLAVAAGGTLTRFGHYEYLYIAMSTGIALIFAGVLTTRRQDRAMSIPNAPGAVENQRPEVTIEGIDGSDGSASPSELSEEVAFLVEKVLPLGPDGMRVICIGWSVQISEDPVMSRNDARRAWRLRMQLPEDGREKFDELPVPERRALVELAADVLQMPALTRFDDARSRVESVKLLEG